MTERNTRWLRRTVLASWTALALLSAVICVADEVAPTEVLLIKVEGATLPGTKFDHAIHKDKECKVCHHLGTYDQKCTECHLAKGKDETPNNQDAFHQNCLECHVEGGSANGKAIGCMDCHKE